MIDVLVPEQEEGVEMTVNVWLKEIGSVVRRGDVLAEMTTDKVNLEVESPAEGTLVEIVAAAGAVVRPGAVLARIAETAVPS
jgi:pyruvate/2-oxoglutarate dehydrogenase complex dihydrolipoamide acyltransferase (E2) component